MERVEEKLQKTALLMAFLALSLAFTTYQPRHADADTPEPTAVQILSALGFTNVGQIANETLRAGAYRVTLHAEFAAYHTENELSYYEVGTSAFTVLFTGPEGGFGYLAQPLSKNITIYSEFSLSLLAPESQRYFAEQSRNPDGEVHAKVYRNLNNPNMVFVCFEDLYGGGDKDYQDMIVSLEFLYGVQFYLTIMTPYGTPLTEGWYYDGTTAFASLSTGLVDHGNRTRHAFTGWSGDASGTDHASSSAIIMDRNKTATANWKTQHSLSVQNVPLLLNPQPTRNPEGQAGEAGSWWYDSSTDVVLTAQQVTGYYLDHWNVDGFARPDSLNPITVTMDEPHTASALYARIQTLSVSIYPLSVLLPPGDSVYFSSSVSGGVPPCSYQWYVDDVPAQGATSNTWVFSPESQGVYYVYLRVTDFLGTTAQSKTARVEVASTPIGGYSINLNHTADRLQLTGFTMMLAFFGAALSLARRKRKQN